MLCLSNWEPSVSTNTLASSFLPGTETCWFHLNHWDSVVRAVGGEGAPGAYFVLILTSEAAWNGGEQLSVGPHRPGIKHRFCNFWARCISTSHLDSLSLTRSNFKIRISILCKTVVELDVLMCMKILISSRSLTHDSNDWSPFSPISFFLPFFLPLLSLSFRKDHDPIEPTRSGDEGRNSSSFLILY